MSGDLTVTPRTPYDRLNDAWKEVEEKLGSIPGPKFVDSVPCPAFVGGVLLWCRYGQQGWRIGYHDPGMKESKPIPECTFEVRLKAAPYVKDLYAAVMERMSILPEEVETAIACLKEVSGCSSTSVGELDDEA